MTDEIPTDLGRVFCTECNRQVKLRRTKNRTLEVSCSHASRSIKVATVLPDGWM